MELRRALAAIVGEAWVDEAPVVDVRGRRCGPLLRVRPVDTHEVAAVVALCRRHRAPLVPLGAATAYWAPLPASAAVAIDVARLDTVTFAGAVCIAGAGLAVRPLDRALRARGGHLSLHPDAFGNTSIGALVAVASTSGIGMGHGPLALAGLEVVTGAGEVVWTGSAALPGVPPILREGLPDLTGAFLGAEGGLGVITKVALLHRAAPFVVNLSGRVAGPNLERVLPLGQALAGVYATFRLVRTLTGGDDHAVDVSVTSPWSAAEALDRAGAVAARLRAAGVELGPPVPEREAARAGALPDHDARFAGPIDGLREFTARAALFGLDVNAAYGDAPALRQLAESMFEAQRAAGVPESRIAWYLAPDFVNLGVHATVPHGGACWGETEAAPWFSRFLALPVIPYRLGRVWPVPKDFPTAELRALKHHFDPDNLCNPGHPLWT